MSTPVLVTEKLVAGYGEASVLAGISLKIEEGRTLALLGRNGTGKTTFVNTLAGVTTHHSGTVHLMGRDVTKLRADRRAAAGIGWVPQERNIFKSLTVEENMTAIARPGVWTLERVYSMFPRLKERRKNLGNQLSGGEQQMLAVGRALMVNPKLLLLDEPTEGLAPIIVDELLAAIQRITQGEGMSAIIIEQKARKVLPLSDDAVILDRGAIVYQGKSADLLANDDILGQHLTVEKGARH
ncbi:branched-chain amino acid transport system ATP-binding protein [Neorhizobium sp. 2083]|uniref:ABC transporter ATP-binding protein n=1 Tax=Neorhizobium sp. 2083 TaxID=2817762 RepID=UPI002857CBF1|nr:ABC transporter ATP-binding protein [Neorhizobium sp. 2083]MDR6817969.1 branched-chain amino acid transport system ATP-binding protein [Neorhizobium sp. 2083]